MEQARKDGILDTALPSQLLEIGMAAAQDSDLAEARRLLGQMLAEDPEYVDALLWKSVLCEEIEDKICSLQRALDLSPDNRRAKTLLRWAQSRYASGKSASIASEIDFLTACPHLGSRGDPGSRFAYPCAGNRCHAEATERNGPRAIAGSVQEETCLKISHLICPAYLRAQARRREAEQPENPGLQAYFDFYGLREEPFSIVPATRFFFSTRQHHEALLACHQMIIHRQGLAILSAPIGMGKTLILQRLYEELFHDPGYRVGLIQHSDFHTEYALMRGILQALHVRPKRRRSLQDLEEVFREYVSRQVSSGHKTVVMLFDEGHQMRYRALRQLRKLLDLHTSGQQMVQIVLAGQPALLSKLQHIQDLHDRIAAQAGLGPLAPSDVKGLIWARLREAGATKRIFTPDAIRAITDISQGHPRRINVLCMNCMWRAHEEGQHTVDHALVIRVTKRREGLQQDQEPLAGNTKSPSLMERLQALGQRAGLA